MVKTIMIDDVEYVRAGEVLKMADEVDGLKYCVVRSYGAGVFCGYVKEQKSEINGVNVTLINSRRIFYWSGACSLSQLAVEGSKSISSCHIAIEVPEEFISNVVEIIPMSAEAKENITGAEVWKI